MLQYKPAIPDSLSVADTIAVFKYSGYLTYLLPFIGIAKLSGVIAVLISGFPISKEGVYADWLFDLSDVLYSLTGVNDPISGIVPGL